MPYDSTSRVAVTWPNLCIPGGANGVRVWVMDRLRLGGLVQLSLWLKDVGLHLYRLSP